MADFEDPLSPTGVNMLQGQVNLRDAVRRVIVFKNPDGKTYTLNEMSTTLLVRPRGWHPVNYHTFELARDYGQRGMTAYSLLQNNKFAVEADGYTATRHQREVGTAYFDRVLNTITGGTASTGALKGSTEIEQFQGQLASTEK